MRIKPYVILGAATLCAGAGLGIIITVSEPATAEPVMVTLFWASLALAILCLVATVCSAIGLRLAFALWTGVVWAAAAVGLSLSAQSGLATGRLLGGVISVTILVSFVLWRYSRRGISYNTPEHP